jgi:AcrR family transcriptional regulator
MSQGSSVGTETGARARTRRAILDAAVTQLAKNPAASLGDIAAAANVGRTTVHRYFPERSDLLDALTSYAFERIATATERARLDEDTAAQALHRLLQEYFEFGEIFQLFFTVPAMITNGAVWEQETESDRALLRLVERGHADGTIDPELPPEWVQQLIWAMLFGAWEHARDYATKHESLTLTLRSLDKIITP